MTKQKEIKITTTVIRHHPQFSRLATIPVEKISPWKLSATTVVEGTINGVDLGRRSMKRWEERNCWWIDLPEQLCKKLKIDVGSKIDLKLHRASEELPRELTDLLATNSTAKARWDQLTSAQKRMLREEIFAAKSTDTRTRRAAKMLC